jgi:aminopeptidase-like protein
MYRLVEELFPVCRSITGEGIRQTLRRVQREVPIVLHEIPSGTAVLDWTVPPEWNIRDAYIARGGERVVDFRASNLHVVSYSTPVRRRMTLAELRPRLFSLPDHPDWIPYRTSYWTESWGFCLSHRQLAALPEGEYDVCIDSTLAAGSLTYGELLVPGSSTDEVLISCHACHPSLANDNLSALAVATELARQVLAEPRALSYRFIFLPGTIGSIAWLARNEADLGRIKHGLVLSCLGDSGPVTYKRSRRGNAAIDRAASHVLSHAGQGGRVREFLPYGYDERQYCSPGFDLPVGCFTRTPNGEFPEYHTSADNLDLVAPGPLADSYATLSRILEVLEQDRGYLRTDPRGEPQLGRRGLYHGVAGVRQLPEQELALLWVLNLADNRHSLLDIAERAGLPFARIREAAMALREKDLIREA